MIVKTVNKMGQDINRMMSGSSKTSKRDQKSPTMVHKRLQIIIPSSNQEIRTQIRKGNQCLLERGIKQMLELFDKDFKIAIIKVIQ